MDNNCVLFEDELLKFVNQIVGSKIKPCKSGCIKNLLEYDGVSRTVSSVSFSSNYGEEPKVADRMFYILDGSGRFNFADDCLRYIAGDIVVAPARVFWSFESDKEGTMLIEVAVSKNDKKYEKDEEVIKDELSP